MPTGTNLQADVGDLMPRVDTSVSAQQSRIMRHGDVVLRQITAEILGVNPYYRLDSVNWTTVASRSPNEYTIVASGDINIANFMGAVHLYRIISDATGDYEEIPHFDQVRQQHDMGSEDYIRGMLTGTSSSVGRPQNYLINVDSLWLFPISDAAYSMRLWYTKSPAAIAAGTNIDIPYALYNALVYGVVREECMMRKEKEAAEFHSLYQSAMASGIATLHHQIEGPRGINYIRDIDGAYV